MNSKLLLISFSLLLCACSHDVTYHRYRFETVDDVYLCVDNQTPGEYNSITGKLVEKDSLVVEKVVMNSYDYCINQLPYPLNLVEKKKDGITVCYDKNNKIELPVLYCQKDQNIIVNVNNDINMQQTTNVSQKSIMKNTMYF